MKSRLERIMTSITNRAAKTFLFPPTSHYHPRHHPCHQYQHVTTRIIQRYFPHHCRRALSSSCCSDVDSGSHAHLNLQSVTSHTFRAKAVTRISPRISTSIQTNEDGPIARRYHRQYHRHYQPTSASTSSLSSYHHLISKSVSVSQYKKSHYNFFSSSAGSDSIMCPFQALSISKKNSAYKMPKIRFSK